MSVTSAMAVEDNPKSITVHQYVPSCSAEMLGRVRMISSSDEGAFIRPKGVTEGAIGGAVEGDIVA